MLASRQVIQAIAARLAAAGTTAGARVYAARNWPVEEFPAIRVVAGEESLDGEADDITFPRERTHQLAVDVRCLVRDATGADEAADELAEEVLLALEGTQAAASLVPLAGCNLAATRISRTPQTEGEAACFATTVTLEVLFSTASNDPATLI